MAGLAEPVHLPGPLPAAFRNPPAEYGTQPRSQDVHVADVERANHFTGHRIDCSRDHDDTVTGLLMGGQPGTGEIDAVAGCRPSMPVGEGTGSSAQFVLGTPEGGQPHED